MALYANQWGPEGIEYPDGSHALLVAVDVRDPGNDQLISLYPDKDRSGNLPNPISTSSLGNLSFFADPGSYYLLIGGYRVDITIPLHPQEPLNEELGLQGHRHYQNTPATAWLMPHPLPFIPAGIVVTDSLGNTIIPAATYPNSGLVRIDWPSAISGYCDMS